ncbi:hypothetical protein CUMW_183330 [Citrus unshiu]|uniref:Tetraspanin n=1 Tax=Citrus unshiu TaxID=55188 RepID=A0A2H5Q029_CITUN|nr:hypothetical protein CUMW_183330 [Citrus unshiu]
MVRIVRSCIQSLLKMVNSVIGMVGIAMIMYALWLIRVWQRQMDDFPLGDDDPVPWFIYAFLGLRVALCVITCSGHIGAELLTAVAFTHASSRNILLDYDIKYFVELKWLQYMFFVFLFIILEAGVAADVFLNREWEEDFPEDPSGSFTQFKDFIRSNFQFCKWIGLSIVFVQGLSFILAVILKTLGPQRYYDSDDDCDPGTDRVPLLRDVVHPPTYVVGDPVYGPRNDAWPIRVDEKVEMLNLFTHRAADYRPVFC